MAKKGVHKQHPAELQNYRMREQILGSTRGINSFTRRLKGWKRKSLARLICSITSRHKARCDLMTAAISKAHLESEQLKKRRSDSEGGGDRYGMVIRETCKDTTRLCQSEIGVPINQKGGGGDDDLQRENIKDFLPKLNSDFLLRFSNMNSDHLLCNFDHLLNNSDQVHSNSDLVHSNSDLVHNNSDQLLCNSDQVLCNSDRVHCNSD
ncbi:hypothetical protein LINPERHAP2_LOCUS33306 [Linum perenne]